MRQDATAQLIPEPANEHDPNAVRVELDGMRSATCRGRWPATTRSCWSLLAARGRVAVCDALLSGGRQGEISALGVFLRLPAPAPAPEPAPAGG